MNEILHSIANRSTGWDSAAFPDVTTFTPMGPHAVLDPLRRAACLVPGFPVYYAVGAIGIIEACPDVRREFGERSRTYDIARYVRPNDQFTGGILRANKTGPMSLNRVPTEWPVRMDIKVTALNDAAVQVEYSNVTEVVDANYRAGWLSLDWPAATGVNGRVELNTWSAGDVFTIYHEPAGFPVQALLDRLDNMSEFHIMMGGAKLAAAFRQAADPTDKAAIFYLALGKSNSAVYP